MIYCKNIFTKFHKKKTTFGLLQRQIEHKGTKIKHLCINCNKKKLDVLGHYWLPKMLNQSQCCIFSLLSTWKGYFLGFFFAIKSGRKCDLVFSSQRNTCSRHFDYKFIHEGHLFWINFYERSHILPPKWKTLGSYVVDLYTGNYSDLLKQHICTQGLFAYTSRKFFKNENYLYYYQSRMSKKCLELWLFHKTEISEGLKNIYILTRGLKVAECRDLLIYWHWYHWQWYQQNHSNHE